MYKYNFTKNSDFERLYSGEHMRLLIDAAPDAIIIFDQDGKIIEWNNQAESLFGWTKAEVFGKDAVEVIIPPQNREFHHDRMANFLQNRDASTIEGRIIAEGIRKDGSTFPIESTIVVQESQRYFTVFIRDISERRKYESNLELLAAIFESSDDAIISKTLDGTITSWNRGAQEIFGWSAEEALGKNIRFIIPADRLQEEDEIIATLKTGGRIDHYETVRITKDGDLRDISVTASPLKNVDGDIIGASKIARDITGRKRTKAKLADYIDRLKKSNEALDDFVYLVSHDLKEPIRGIRNYAQFLIEDYGDALAEDGKSMLLTLQNLSLRMKDLIDSLLEYSRLDRVANAKQPVDLNRIVAQTLELMEPVAGRDNDVEIRVQDDLPTIVCDGTRVGEVFRNLITNGIKYNDSDRKIIEVGYRTDHPASPGQPVFFVRDNGIGIPPDRYETVFKMFKRLHEHDKYGGGTGSGLPIVKKIIENGGGKIWIEPNDGRGTVFFFTIEPESQILRT